MQSLNPRLRRTYSGPAPPSFSLLLQQRQPLPLFRRHALKNAVLDAPAESREIGTALHHGDILCPLKCKLLPLSHCGWGLGIPVPPELILRIAVSQGSKGWGQALRIAAKYCSVQGGNVAGLQPALRHVSPARAGKPAVGQTRQIIIQRTQQEGFAEIGAPYA